MIRRWATGVFGLGILLGCVGLLAGAEMRTWTDQAGQHATRASLVRVQGNKIILQREDGTQIQVDREKLSRTDQQYLADHGDDPQNPFQVEEDPLAGQGGNSPHVNLDNPMYPQGQLADIDWQTIPKIPLKEAEWQVKVSPPSLTESGIKLQPLALPPRREFFEKYTGIAVSQPSQRVLISYTSDKAKSGAETRLVLCFLGEARWAQAPGPGFMVPMALSDNGELALMCTLGQNFGVHEPQDRLEIWSLTASGVVTQAQWYPYDRCQDRARNVRWAAFLGDNQVATLGGNGILAVWNTTPLKPLFHMQIDPEGTPSVSPDRQYLAFTAQHKLWVVDVKRHRVAGVQTIERAQNGHCVFSPLGQQLACESFQQLNVLNSETGEIISQIACGPSWGKVVWTGPSHILVGNSVLYDVPGQTQYWVYDGIQTMVPCQGHCWCLMDAGFGRQGLIPYRIPHEGIQVMMEKLAGYPKLLPLRPGAYVHVDCEVISDAKLRDEVRKALSKRLEDNGAKSVEKGEVEIAVAVQAGKAQQVNLRTAPNAPTKSYSFQPSVVSLQVVYHGEPLWGVTATPSLGGETTGGNRWRGPRPWRMGPPPGFMRAGIPAMPGMPGGVPALPAIPEEPPEPEVTTIHLEANETVEQYLQKRSEPCFDWLKGVNLPRYVSRFGTQGLEGTIGRSRVTLRGIEEASLIPTEKGNGPRPAGPAPNNPPAAPPDNKPRWK